MFLLLLIGYHNGAKIKIKLIMDHMLNLTWIQMHAY